MNDTLKEDATRFSEFLLKEYPRAREWVDPLGFCAWNIAHGFIAAVVDGPEEIVAMGVARPVDRPGFGVLPYYFNEYGKCIHVDVLVDTTDDPRAVIVLRQFFGIRFGHRRHVTMFRHHEEKLHIYTYQKFWLNLNRMKMAKKRKRERNVNTKSASGAKLRAAT